jgi:UDP-N-acetylmuramoylalanine--D-glutamate ligase
VLIGEAAPLIEEALAGTAQLERGSDMADAVARASALAQPGDAVVLAPACSSFDMFSNYKARGHAFAKAVADFLPPKAISGDSIR